MLCACVGVGVGGGYKGWGAVIVMMDKEILATCIFSGQVATTESKITSRLVSVTELVKKEHNH